MRGKCRGGARHQDDRDRPFRAHRLQRKAIELLSRLGALRKEAGRASQPFEAIVPLVTPPDADVFRRLADAGMTSTTAWPFLYTLGPSSTLAQKRESMLRFGEQVIAKLG